MDEDIKSDSKRLLLVMLVFVLVIIFAAGIYHFVTKRPAEPEVTLQSKVASLEEKIKGLEKQIANLQDKPAPMGSDPSLVQRVEALSQKVEVLERKAQPSNESRTKLAPPKAAPKRSHTVQKGETLSGISKKYGISVEELRKLNGLSPGQPPRKGQKLLISTGE